jgi:hypothetical protein
MLRLDEMLQDVDPFGETNALNEMNYAKKEENSLLFHLLIIRSARTAYATPGAARILRIS